MKLQDIVWIRFSELIILQYYVEYNSFRVAQVALTGGYNKYTEFMIPAGIFGVQPAIHFPDINNKKMKEKNGIHADLWIGDKPYYIYTDTTDYEITGQYYLYELIPGKSLLNTAIADAVDLTKDPIIKRATPIYDEVQKGDGFINQTIRGKDLKGQVIILFSKVNNTEELIYHDELTPMIMENRFAVVHAVISINNHWLQVEANKLKFK